MASFISPSLSHLFPLHKDPPSPIKYRIRTTKLHRNRHKALPFVHSLCVFGFQGASKCSKSSQDLPLDSPRRLKQEKDLVFSNGFLSKPEKGVFQCITRPIVLTLFCIAIGFYPLGALPPLAVADVAVASEVAVKKKEKKLNKESNLKEHEFSNYTKSLLEEVSRLLKRIEEVRKGNGSVEEVKLVLKAVKGRKEELQREIMEGMYLEVRQLRKEKGKMENRSEEIVEEVEKEKKEYDNLREEGEKERMEALEERMRVMDEEYTSVWERIGEIGGEILRRETMALSVGVRELCFIERECEELVKRFSQEMRQKSTDSQKKSSITKLPRSEIQKELETAQRKLLEQMILPNVVEVEGLGLLFDQDSIDFAARIRQGLKDSQKLQKDTEALIRKKMKRFGDEKHLVVKTSADEVVKGYPEVELKWMFGDKEVVVPKATHLHLYHSWKKWREEATAELKRKLLEDADFGKEYVAQKQEQVLLGRDRVVSNTWYSEEKKRWEMEPIAVPYAVSKKLVEHARIRHDWGAMYVALKGDDKEYFVDIKEFEILYEDFGGFDGLYMKMLASGIPTSVHLMWIPLSELDLGQQFLMALRLTGQCLNGLWKSRIVSYGRDWVVEKVRNINDDIMMVIVFPMLELIVPFPVRMRLGMAWPEEIDQTVGSTWYLKWQSEAEINFKSRKTDDMQWFFWFAIRLFIYGYILFHAFRFLKRKVPRLLGFGPLRSRDPNFLKLRRVKYYVKYKLRTIKSKKKAGIDPISTAFDGMKRVKNPPIPLKDFSSVESMREEINEVVAFLQNPGAFQEMGARAPRGVLIVGERGTGKTSLALAIAAEARVPVVKVEAQQLEAGLWVGQSASNVRELFQTARDLGNFVGYPLIPFESIKLLLVECAFAKDGQDFDLFAGVRGKFIHTKKQDHEAFINQLLVELDGFQKQDGVVLMATTRNINQIDEALQRPGRMDRVFYLQQPTQAEREKILHLSAKETMDEDLIDFVDWRKVAEKTALLRPVELKLVPVALEGSAFKSKFLDTDELMSYCSWFATFSCLVPDWVRKTKIAKKMSRMMVNHLGLTLSKEDLQNVVDLMEPYGQISNGIELLNPPLDGIGCTKISKAKNEGSLNGNSESRSYLEKKPCILFWFIYIIPTTTSVWGRKFSLFFRIETGSGATRMVIQYGWGPDDSPAIYYSNKGVTFLSTGNSHEYEMAAKVEKLYDLAYLKAKGMLQKNRRVLEKIVEELLEFEILSGKDLERMVDDNGGIREKSPFPFPKLIIKRHCLAAFLDQGQWSRTLPPLF
ncbi:inactive ATP-dependent zinc metalloprotease FTSHI 5 [Populus alba x Populus x berolinensis]|nr:inactive ATP-dependent zinc metalloprotease FTSHI 5 [Populus alba x Populus x berolinensis]